MYYKITFHHFCAHLIDDLRKIGKVIGCFATERKHKDLYMLHASRDEEYTTTTSHLNAFVDGVTSGEIVFEPRVMIGQPTIDKKSNRQYWLKAELEIGELAAKDVIIAVCQNQKVVGSIERFFKSQIGSEVVVQLQKYRHVQDYIGKSIISDWARSHEIVEICASTIVAAPMWARRNSDVVFVVEPAML